MTQLQQGNDPTPPIFQPEATGNAAQLATAVASSPIITRPEPTSAAAQQPSQIAATGESSDPASTGSTEQRQSLRKWWKKRHPSKLAALLKHLHALKLKVSPSLAGHC